MIKRREGGQAYLGIKGRNEPSLSEKREGKGSPGVT